MDAVARNCPVNYASAFTEKLSRTACTVDVSVLLTSFTRLEGGQVGKWNYLDEYSLSYYIIAAEYFLSAPTFVIYCLSFLKSLLVRVFCFTACMFYRSDGKGKSMAFVLFGKILKVSRLGGKLKTQGIECIWNLFAIHPTLLYIHQKGHIKCGHCRCSWAVWQDWFSIWHWQWIIALQNQRGMLFASWV